VPGYALAGLIKQGLERGVGPELVREAARGTARRLDEMHAEHIAARAQELPHDHHTAEYDNGDDHGVARAQELPHRLPAVGNRSAVATAPTQEAPRPSKGA
jgi:hypothetical protein